MNILRLIYGVMLGTIAWSFMLLADRANLGQSHWVRKRAITSCCRMTGLGGGIDEGSDSLMDGWGQPARHLLHTMRCNNEIPNGAAFGAYVYDTIENELCVKWKAGTPIPSVKFSLGQTVTVNHESSVDQEGKIIGLNQATPFPIYVVQLGSGRKVVVHSEQIATHV